MFRKRRLSQLSGRCSATVKIVVIGSARHLDREEKHEEQEHQNEERDDPDSEEHGEEWEK